jgi:hypothetical protein
MMGIIREHLFNASDDITTWILELTGNIFAGLSPSILKQGAIAPLPKVSKRKHFECKGLLNPLQVDAPTRWTAETRERTLVATMRRPTTRANNRMAF